ncbi:MAG: hypothetical protein LBK95_17325 [Bifidobacteriaceae bacterium]|nr:hypothetical protein [Bifidobacteriaceae bacterium]
MSILGIVIARATSAELARADLAADEAFWIEHRTLLIYACAMLMVAMLVGLWLVMRRRNASGNDALAAVPIADQRPFAPSVPAMSAVPAMTAMTAVPATPAAPAVPAVPAMPAAQSFQPDLRVAASFQIEPTTAPARPERNEEDELPPPLCQPVPARVPNTGPTAPAVPDDSQAADPFYVQSPGGARTEPRWNDSEELPPPLCQPVPAVHRGT